MKRVALMLSLLLAACVGNPEPPATAPTASTAPPPLSENGYAQVVIRADFPGTPAEVRAYLDDGNKILYAMPDTDRIARPVSFELTKGETWTAAGSERVMKFSDDHYAFERVIDHSPESFTYQVWGFTGPNAANVDHIHGEQRLVADPDGGTDFIWTYRVKPTAGWKRPFVQRFVDSDVRELLQTATDRVAARAREDMTP